MYSPMTGPPGHGSPVPFAPMMGTYLHVAFFSGHRYAKLMIYMSVY